MTRVLKHRVWDKNRKIWLEGVDLFYHKGKWFETFRDVEDYTPFDDTEIEVVQFAGLHDKNGKKIYEGDIVTAFEDTFSKDDMQIRVVKLYDGGFRMLYVDKEDGVADWHDGHTVDKILSEKIEIIGNIYENPELLEVDAE